MNTAAYEHTSCRRWTRQQYLKSIHIEQQYSVHEKHGIFSETLYILSLYIYSNRKKKKGSKKYHFYHMRLFFAVSSMLLSMVKFDNPTIFHHTFWFYHEGSAMQCFELLLSPLCSFTRASASSE